MAGIVVRGRESVNRVALKLQSRAGLLHQKNVLAMQRVTAKLERDVKQTGFTGKAGDHPLFGKTGASGDALAVVTGHSRRSITRRVFAVVTKVVGVVGSPLASVQMHEFGGTVHGKPLLRIPTKFMKTASGADRLAGRSARSLPHTRIFRSRAGNLWVWEVGTARAKASPHGVIPLYLLKPSVKLRARHMFRNALRANRIYINSQFRAVAAYLANGTH